MTGEEFSAGPAYVLDGGWPGDFTEEDERAYFFLLSDFSAAAVMGALRALRGRKFRPAASEIMEALSPEDAGTPTFDELVRLLYDPRGVLNVRVRGTVDTNPAYRRDVEAAVTERLEGVHPAVGGFVRSFGVYRLRHLDVEDPDEGHWRRRELKEAWEAYVAAADGREIAVLASGARSGNLSRLDPLAVLGEDPDPGRLGLPKGS